MLKAVKLHNYPFAYFLSLCCRPAISGINSERNKPACRQAGKTALLRTAPHAKVAQLRAIVVGYAALRKLSQRFSLSISKSYTTNTSA
ncbi:hypothetical protein CJD36_015615 [Flavipsychrobacter stenotrophus]|uniref:Uncharacterized protein n=1 Tax=Flavipsychrobacter stenotrophus TaxID=2077091 RepID=A0A2S7ST77_9BACT|nr:hypothetical protein CJD36_015615 [Flavipsychrobacter stenotrophus]